jgi:membrane-associated phospholipid phosphatase
VLIPGRLGFSPALMTGMLTPLFDLMTAVDTPHNLVPSLHVTFAALILLGCAERASRPLAWIYRLWLAVMSASTLFVHQHHLLDVATGLGLAAAVRRVFPLDEAPARNGI